MTEPRARLRAAVVLLALSAALLPATAAHATLPVDVGGHSAQSASDEDEATTDDADGGWAEDDSTSEYADDEGEEVDDEDADADSSGASSAVHEGVASHVVTKARPGKPRGVRARIASFARASVTWRAGGGATTTRYVVTLRSGRVGKVVYARASARSVSFASLKPRTRYTATVTAYGRHGIASASTTFRTPSLTTAVRQATKAKAKAERDLRLAKAARFS